ncbi:putative amidohydrolase [Hyphomonas adhaerens MHS-3]|uniref:Putative amidohydrolase n=1 Tax=Hyphomonas adhaerens MHS-3 TaxID=1280949 RepID=A0A069E605_9PROT|nr:carbon-nitrogen hydrolase family protein [Hyphomonas adhaerens]KCZ85512.1 putative amidohydrolase [Hyphomonas adhaerens MHS-3]
MPKFTVAAVQAGSKLFDTPATIALFADKLKEAAKTGADLAVFPEAFIGGYPKGIDFGVRVGMRQPEGREQFRQYFDGAIERTSPQMADIQALVKEAQINTVLGLIERDGGTLYCSSVAMGRDGEILSWHRKLMPTAMEKVIWGQGDGSTMKVAKSDMGVLSMAICWENYMPLFRSHLYDQGTQVHCVSTVDDRDVWLPTMQTIALEGRCFVVSACQYMTVGDVRADWFEPVQGTAPDTVLIRGGSCIISPMGEVLAAPVFNESTIVSAEIDLDDIKRAKFDLDISGHYSRPDVFRLSVDTAPQR